MDVNVDHRKPGSFQMMLVDAEHRLRAKAIERQLAAVATVERLRFVGSRSDGEQQKPREPTACHVRIHKMILVVERHAALYAAAARTARGE
jgi:hypothetical protein